MVCPSEQIAEIQKIELGWKRQWTWNEKNSHNKAESHGKSLREESELLCKRSTTCNRMRTNNREPKTLPRLPKKAENLSDEEKDAARIVKATRKISKSRSHRRLQRWIKRITRNAQRDETDSYVQWNSGKTVDMRNAHRRRLSFFYKKKKPVLLTSTVYTLHRHRHSYVHIYTQSRTEIDTEHARCVCEWIQRILCVEWKMWIGRRRQTIKLKKERRKEKQRKRNQKEQQQQMHPPFSTSHVLQTYRVKKQPKHNKLNIFERWHFCAIL